MKSCSHLLTDALFTLGTIIVVFLVNLFLVEQFSTKTMTPMIFVLGVFLVSWRTQGYVWGIAASLISVLAVNWAFTYPYWAFDLISPECISSAVVMLIVATMTGALTTRLKQQEKLKAEAEKERMRGNLLRAVSHDLRTPLTSIYGACDLMLENYTELTEAQHRKMLKDVRADAQWLRRMVENLLSVTRVDTDKVKLSKQPTVPDELIDAVLVKFRKHYPDRDVILELPETLVSIPMDALDLGANDYITKPFGTAELLARVRAALRIKLHSTRTAAPFNTFELLDLTIDYDRRLVSVADTLIHLTQTEYNILSLLSQHTGKVLTYSSIIRSIWGSMDDGSIKKLQVNMANIRKKLGCRPGDNRYFINELGVGYRMLDD